MKEDWVRVMGFWVLTGPCVLSNSLALFESPTSGFGFFNSNLRGLDSVGYDELLFLGFKINLRVATSIKKMK